MTSPFHASSTHLVHVLNRQIQVLLKSSSSNEVFIDDLSNGFSIPHDTHGRSSITPHPHMTSTLQFIGMVLMLPPLIWCVLAASYMLRRIYRRWSARQQRASRLRALKVRKYIVPEDDEKVAISSGKICHNSSCVICLEEFKLGTNITVLPCKHGFHSECIVPWLRDRSDQCPICKQTIVVQSEQKFWKYFGCAQVCIWLCEHMRRRARSHEVLPQSDVEISHNDVGAASSFHQDRSHVQA
mmetsp:Transcript_26025/g.36353  ORF Transcript_26025/g.36353 Transcript_26025/m.36353 type:complete len:241 (+) Transcript_26025:489-1211(+)